MGKFTILTDATCDLSEEFRKQYDIAVLPSHIVVPGGKELSQFPVWDHFTKEEFYKALKKDPDGFKTSPATIGEVKAKMEEELAAGRGVLVITISTAISGFNDFAHQAAAIVKESNPRAEIEIVDSLRYGPALGLMCMYASMKRSEGLSLKETRDWLEANKPRFHQAGWLDDLSFVAKKGRLTHAKAFFGTLAGVKPIGEFDYNGLTTVLGKATGARSAYGALISYMEKTIEDPEDQIIMIAETFRYNEAVRYKAMIEEKFHPKAVCIQDVYAICGVNVGPGLMAAFYMGKPISKDLSEERALVEEALRAGK